jgi:hypothetical protein
LFFRKIYIIIFIITGFFASCTINWNTTSHEMNTRTDYTFSITGTPVETNNIVSILEKSIKKDDRLPPNAGILLKGQIKEPLVSFGAGKYLLGFVKLKNQGDYTHLYHLPSEMKPFLWDGSITVNGKSVNTEITFDVYANKDGNDKHFILTNAALQKIHLEFDDPFDIYTGGSDYFPFLIGYVDISGSKYRLYAVLDNFPNKRFYNEVFYNPMQKFQLIDGQNTVLAEIEKDKYIIYDTTPEAERENLKYAIALIVAFRHSTSVLKNIRNEWSPPVFYRYIYQ